MATATIARGATSVTLALDAEGNDLAIARDVGKPRRETALGAAEKIHPRGDKPDPRSEDNLSGRDAFVVNGLLDGASAYSDAQTLAGLVKAEQEPSGDPLTLEFSGVTGLSDTYRIGVPTGDALDLSYPPGQRQRVDVTLSVEVYAVA